MEYKFDEEVFRESFKAKSIETKPANSLRLTHRSDIKFKLFPYKAAMEKQAPAVTDLKDVVSSFFREALNKKVEPIRFDELCCSILDEVEVEQEDMEYFKDMLQSIFFLGEHFVADNLGLYPYQTVINNKSVENLAHFLFSVFQINEDDCYEIIKAKNKHRFNVLENIVIKTIEEKKVSQVPKRNPYFSIKTDIQDRFREDFYFMLESGMTSLDDLSNLFAIYYFFYISQSCIILNHYCKGKRNGEVELYYALDWEKVSKNRKCCEQGWKTLQESISNMFSHAITLEILNQTKDGCMLDYIEFGKIVSVSPELDQMIAEEVAKAEMTYCSYVGDYRFDKITEQQGTSKTDKAIRHLFECVNAQFLEKRAAPSQRFGEKYSDFCKSRWVKNRKKSGLVLNLTERDIIFLTKICHRKHSKIRLNDLYKEYEHRGVYLDNTSKEYLQNYFTNLNLIDKKSDSGDAQYVKRIL